MAKKLGNDYRPWIESAVAGTYNEIKGNTTLSISRSGSTFSIGTKSDFPVDPQAPGSRGHSISLGVIPDLPDADGYERLMTLARSSSVAAIGFQIRKGGSSGVTPGDVVYECDVYVTQDDNDLNQNSPVGASVTLVAGAVPTIDELA